MARKSIKLSDEVYEMLNNIGPGTFEEKIVKLLNVHRLSTESGQNSTNCLPQSTNCPPDVGGKSFVTDDQISYLKTKLEPWIKKLVEDEIELAKRGY